MQLQPAQNPVNAINTKISKDEVGRLFAVIHLCGKQFKVTTGDIILVEGYWEPKNGDQIKLNKVNQCINQLMKPQIALNLHFSGPRRRRPRLQSYRSTHLTAGSRRHSSDSHREIIIAHTNTLQEEAKEAV